MPLLLSDSDTYTDTVPSESAGRNCTRCSGSERSGKLEQKCDREGVMIRLLLGVLGVTGVIVALPLLFGGGGLVWVDETLTDADGYLTAPPVDVAVDGYAIVAGPAEIADLPDLPIGVPKWASLRIRVESQSPSRGIFVGIAAPETLDGYLRDVSHAVVEGIDETGWVLAYRTAEGETIPGAPGEQAFWSASAAGAGPQTLIWEIETGEHSIVVMNEDGSSGLQFDTELGTRLPMLRPTGVSLLVAGALALAAGTILLALAL